MHSLVCSHTCMMFKMPPWLYAAWSWKMTRVVSNNVMQPHGRTINTASLFSLPGHINGANCTSRIGDIIYSLSSNAHTHHPSSPQASSSKRNLSQSTRSKSPVSREGRRTPLICITDIINNGHLMSLLNKSCKQTNRPTITFQQTPLRHNLHLSRIHNRLVFNRLSRPPQKCLLMPCRFNGPFISTDRNRQCQTRLAQKGGCVGTWEMHGPSVLRLVIPHNKFWNEEAGRQKTKAVDVCVGWMFISQ